MVFTVRPAHEHDLDFIIELSAEVFSRYGNYKEIVNSWYREPGVITEIITDQESSLGFVMLAMEEEKIFRARKAHLLAIGVLPDHQRKGIGTALLAKVQDLARQYGGKEMFLMTGVDNDAALAFFRNAGFRIIGTEDHYYPRGQSALAMRKRLA
jgi:ribosomal protein S18 acetylase RimI-like enzyme